MVSIGQAKGMWRTRAPVHSARNRSQRARALTLALAAVGSSLLIAACGGSGASTGGSSNGPITIGVVAPFSGPMAQVGQLFDAACVAGAYAVNHGGGVMGRHVVCHQVDDTGDPADAVPNTERAIASLGNFDLAVGLDTSTAATTIPLVNQAKIPLFTLNGLAAFNNTKDQYYWRLVPDDTQHGAGLALWASQHGEKRIALVFQNSASADAAVPGILPAAKKLGMTVLQNELIPGDLSSYSSSVVKVIAAHPQAILMDGDPQTVGTYFANYSQLNHGQVPPLLATTDLVLPDFFSEMKRILGPTFVPSHVTFVGFQVLNQPEAYAAYKQALAASFSRSEAQSLLAQNLSVLYDAVIYGALAMDEAHSTSGAVYNKDIGAVASSRPGSVVVHTYPEGVAAIRAGKQVDYVGVEGQLSFNSHHNVVSNFEAFHPSASGSVTSLAVIPAAAARGVLP